MNSQKEGVIIERNRKVEEIIDRKKNRFRGEKMKLNKLTTRVENDSVGTLDIDRHAYYGIQTFRAKNNFNITGVKMSHEFIKQITLIKKAAAIVNKNAGLLSASKADAIISACDDVMAGKYQDQFIVDAIQGGAGTSANMNVNEVVANVAIEKLGGTKGDYSIVHPNDDVNMEQSTNDVIPTAGKLTVLKLSEALIEQLELLKLSLTDKAKEFDGILKMGRTQLQDAVPMRLGQSFEAFASSIARDINRLILRLDEMRNINMGATAIGTAINVKPEYFNNIIKHISLLSEEELTRPDDLFDATQNIDSFVAISGTLKTLAINLSKMCNDLRLMSSGPRTGLNEIVLPAKQNGSSIMPGKINPVIPEVVNQVAFMVIGHDVTITMAGEAGQLELNAFEPIVFYQLFESITSLTNAVYTLRVNCIEGIQANADRCSSYVFNSVGIVTALAPYIGYAKSSEIAKESLQTGKPVREIALEKEYLDEETLEKLLDAHKLTSPQK